MFRIRTAIRLSANLRRFLLQFGHDQCLRSDPNDPKKSDVVVFSLQDRQQFRQAFEKTPLPCPDTIDGRPCESMSTAAPLNSSTIDVCQQCQLQHTINFGLDFRFLQPLHMQSMSTAAPMNSSTIDFCQHCKLQHATQTYHCLQCQQSLCAQCAQQHLQALPLLGEGQSGRVFSCASDDGKMCLKEPKRADSKVAQVPHDAGGSC